MLVVLAIIVVVTAIALTSQSKFNQTLVLANTAYDVALSIRNAEIYGIGSRGLGTSANTGYGVDFRTLPSSTFIFFADTYSNPGAADSCHPTTTPSAPDAKPGNCVYDSSRSEAVQTYTLNNGIKVTNFCAVKNGTTYCASGGGSSATVLDIVFARPNTSASISVRSSTQTLAQNMDSACLTISSPTGAAKYVRVTAIGAVDLPASCP